MSVAPWIQNTFLYLNDRIFRYLPQSLPSLQQLQSAKIIAHRGVHDQQRIENTLPAFQQAIDANLAAIEFDIRWTRDLVPVVHHDVDCQRLFDCNINIAEICFDDLHQAVPQIPCLQQVVNTCGGKIHLLIEMKPEIYPQPAKQMAILKQILSPLQPSKDFHLISLSKQLLDYVDFIDKSSLLLVATNNTRQLSQLALEQHYGGLLGHYLFMTKAICHRHRQQQVGVGFISSKNSLFRELKKDVYWLSTNYPLQIQAIIKQQLTLLSHQDFPLSRG